MRARRRLARKRPIRLLGVSSSLCSSARGPSTGAPSFAAACAARRAAAMKFALPVISGAPSRLSGASAASDAAMRSAGERPRPALPGSSGVSAGRSGSIGGRSVRCTCMNGVAGRSAGSEGSCAGSGARVRLGSDFGARVHRRHRLARRASGDGCGAAALGRLRFGMRAGLDHREPLDQALERLVHGFERLVRALLAFGLIDVQRFEVALERLDVAARAPPRPCRPRPCARRAPRSRLTPRAPRAPAASAAECRARSRRDRRISDPPPRSSRRSR